MFEPWNHSDWTVTDGTVGRHENMIVMMYKIKSDRTRGTGRI